MATLSGGPTRIFSEYYLENEQPRLAYETRVTPGALTIESRDFFAGGRLIQRLEAIGGSRQARAAPQMTTGCRSTTSSTPSGRCGNPDRSSNRRQGSQPLEADVEAACKPSASE